MTLFNQPFNLFYFWKFPCNLYNSIDYQGWSDEHTIVCDGFNVLYFNHLSINVQLLDRLFRSLRKLIALRSSHPKYFDLLFHCLYLLLI
jgi:hypothetical protein